MQIEKAGLLVAVVTLGIIETGLFVTRPEQHASEEQLRKESALEYVRKDDLQPQTLVRKDDVAEIKAILQKLQQDNEEIKIRLARIER